MADRPLPIRVTLRSLPPGAWLSVDLHGLSSRREPRGFVSLGGSRRIDARAGSYLFEAPVAAEGDLGYVLAVVYLSPSGRWEDRIAAATTEPIPLRTEDAGGELEPIPTYDRAEPVGAIHPSPTLQLSIAALWLLGGLLVWRTRSVLPRAAAAGDSTRRRSGWLALACFAAGLWELSNAESRLVAAARAVAWEHRLYFERRSLQEAVTVAILLGATALAAVRLRPARARGPDPLQAALWLYAGVSLISVLSWHEADRLLAAPVLAVPLVQIAKLAIAIAALVLARARRP